MAGAPIPYAPSQRPPHSQKDHEVRRKLCWLTGGQAGLGVWAPWLCGRGKPAVGPLGAIHGVLPLFLPFALHGLPLQEDFLAPDPSPSPGEQRPSLWAWFPSLQDEAMRGFTC